jgi:hydroxyacylglutathione hydrolase
MKIWMMPLGDYCANCYIITDELTSETSIIDPGGDALGLINKIRNDKLVLKNILLTHGHIDHTGGVSGLIKECNIPVYINKLDFDLMKAKAPVFGAIDQDIIDNYKFLIDGEILKLGNETIKCINTPGHTPGGMSFIINNKIFTGDTLFYHSIGRTDLSGGDYNEIIKSIKEKIFKLDENMEVLPGHENSSTIAEEILNNPFVN